MPNNKLLLKPEDLGIVEPPTKLVNVFLIDRRQKVRIESKCFSWNPVLSGVLQGSSLSSLLFMTCVNELSSMVESTILLYADAKI